MSTEQAMARKSTDHAKGSAGRDEPSLECDVKRPRASAQSGEVLDLDRYVPALVTQLENKLTNSASLVYREAFGVGATEMRIIVLLGAESNVSGNHIGKVVGLDKGAVSRALKSLETLGLIAISPGFGRRRAVVLTDAGRALHDKGVAISLEREHRLLIGFSEHERDLLITLLQRMIKHMPQVSAVRGLHVPAPAAPAKARLAAGSKAKIA